MIPQPHRTTLFPYTTLFRSQLNGSLKRWPNVKSRETHYTRVLREDWSGAMVSVGSDGRDRAKKSNRAAKAGRGLLFSSVLPLLLLTTFVLALQAPSRRKVIIDQDAAGPGGTDMQAILALVNSPETDVLGITVLTGDDWRDEEVQHTLRLLEIIGRTDIPVLPGAVFPLVNSKEFIAKWETLYGKVE